MLHHPCLFLVLSPDSVALSTTDTIVQRLQRARTPNRKKQMTDLLAGSRTCRLLFPTIRLTFDRPLSIVYLSLQRGYLSREKECV